MSVRWCCGQSEIDIWVFYVCKSSPILRLKSGSIGWSIVKLIFGLLIKIFFGGFHIRNPNNGSMIYYCRPMLKVYYWCVLPIENNWSVLKKNTRNWSVLNSALYCWFMAHLLILRDFCVDRFVFFGGLVPIFKLILRHGWRYLRIFFRRCDCDVKCVFVFFFRYWFGWFFIKNAQEEKQFIFDYCHCFNLIDFGSAFLFILLNFGLLCLLDWQRKSIWDVIFCFFVDLWRSFEYRCRLWFVLMVCFSPFFFLQLLLSW